MTILNDNLELNYKLKNKRHHPGLVPGSVGYLQ
jgi:hypothetical protein